MESFKPLLPPHIIARNVPDSDNDPLPLPRKPFVISPAIRDDMALSSWLLLGGLLQGLSWLALGPLSILPTLLILLYRVVDHLLMAAHITRNRYMDGVVSHKYTNQFPNPDGSFGSTAADKQIVVFLLGARSNHPLGSLAPGMKFLSDSVIAMMRELQADPESAGLLGTTRWLNQEAPAGNETMTVMYWRDHESLQRFAHGSLHTSVMRDWVAVEKKNPHLAIFHETYVVPRGNWESIYVNSKPVGLGDTWFPTRGKNEEGVWKGFSRPIVNARVGPLRSAMGRLGSTQKAHI
ncbi:hypothetical protein N7462_008407 [Penicillium macrosclerotiorum]|uniref:uncharacterized protein n=1 Tax=Penicillium macrosclerotiorum TaxID=303699 RepID=UPI002547F3E9|nr:uncharacterized protein N7462_008407 [Penicillium macrosclerotiorum]KAJ5675510.1 hypothetical protein N7462_008407 [Penicillium macrosclerotiorum]